MMLNNVDLPQPDGPITPKNSPGLTDSDTLSTAVSTPSGVSNCLTIPSTVRIGSAALAPGTRPDGIATTVMNGVTPRSAAARDSCTLAYLSRSGAKLTASHQRGASLGVRQTRSGLTAAARPATPRADSRPAISF